MPISDAHKQKLKEGRDRVMASGKTSRELGLEKVKKALGWIYQWGWSTPHVLETVTNGTRSGIAARLVRQGLIVKTRTENGGYARDMPEFILTLTKLGLEVVENDLTSEADLLEYSCNPLKINQKLLRHDLIAQSATARALRDGTITSYKSDRVLRKEAGRQSLVKIPDALWINDRGMKSALEIELSAKWARDLDMFVHAVLEGFRTSAFSTVLIFSDSAAIRTRYAEAFAPGAKVGSWSRNERTNRWEKTREDQIKTLRGRVICKAYSHS